jgi:hypothetical protein
MPWLDFAVLITIGLTTAVWVRWLWRRDIRGRALAASAWLGFVGLALVVMLLAHCLDVLSRLYIGTAYTGGAFVYNFHVYSLLLLGALLIWSGVQLLRDAVGLSRQDPPARAGALRTLGLVLAIVLPLMPFQAFFAILLSVLSGIAALLVAWLGPRQPSAGLSR